MGSGNVTFCSWEKPPSYSEHQRRRQGDVAPIPAHAGPARIALDYLTCSPFIFLLTLEFVDSKPASRRA
jgi:hypothetical protein